MLQIPDLSAAHARVLLLAGFSDPSSLMLADEREAAKALAPMLPAHMRRKRGDDVVSGHAQVRSLL